MEINDFKNVINANGRMTILGVSTFNDEVGKAMNEAGSRFFVMSEFKEKINSEVNKIVKSKNLHIVNSASAGIALSVAAAIYEGDVYSVNNGGEYRREIIIAKGHNVDYGAPIDTMIKLVGGNVVEAGWANKCNIEDIIYNISDNTSALVYVVSHHAVKKGILSLEEMIGVSKKYKLPLIVDCAAEEDFLKYSSMGIDAVVFSGSKAIEGPTSGLVFGDNFELIENVKKHSNIIGRAMKVGKENIFGLLKAIEKYSLNKKIDIEKYISKFKKTPNVKVFKTTDDRGIDRVGLDFSNITKINAIEISNNLKNGKTAIYLRDYLANQGILEVDVRNITLNDAEIISLEINKML